MRHLPNLITLLRFALVPVMAYYAIREDYGIALPIFLAAALSDFADGYIARAWRLVSRLGAALDPVADKLNMFVATVLLAAQGRIPLWLAAAIICRDIVIVAGVLAYRGLIGPVEMKPTRLSKANTFVEFGALLLAMAAAANWVELPRLLSALFAITLVTVIASGAQYVALGTRMALAERRRKV